MGVEEGWYEDPSNPEQYRFWDGNEWTNETAPKFVEEEAAENLQEEKQDNPGNKRKIITIAVLAVVALGFGAAFFLTQQNSETDIDPSASPSASPSETPTGKPSPTVSPSEEVSSSEEIKTVLGDIVNAANIEMHALLVNTPNPDSIGYIDNMEDGRVGAVSNFACDGNQDGVLQVIVSFEGQTSDNDVAVTEGTCLRVVSVDSEEKYATEGYNRHLSRYNSPEDPYRVGTEIS